MEDSRSDGQDVPRLIRNSRPYRRICALYSAAWIGCAVSRPVSFFKLHFNIIFPSARVSRQWSLY